MRISEKIKFIAPLLLSAGLVSLVEAASEAVVAKSSQVKLNPAPAEICQRSLPIFGVAFGNDLGPNQRGDSKFGLPVIYVKKDSPAEKAGIQIGDLLLTFDKQKLFFPSQFAALLRTYDPGDSIEVCFRRGNENFSANVELGVRDGRALNRASGNETLAPANSVRDDIRIVINGREISLSKNTDLKNRVAMTPDGIIIRTNPEAGVPDDLQRIVERFRRVLDLPQRIDSRFYSGFAGVPVITTSSQIFSNNENTVVFTRENDKRDVVVRTAKNGEIFRGPCATQEEIDAIPTLVLSIIRQMTVLRPLPEAEKKISAEKNENTDKK